MFDIAEVGEIEIHLIQDIPKRLVSSHLSIMKSLDGSSDEMSDSLTGMKIAAATSSSMVTRKREAETSRRGRDEATE